MVGFVKRKLHAAISVTRRAADDSANATLRNVRDRALRSALAWEDMADEVRVTEVYQQANEAARRG